MTHLWGEGTQIINFSLLLVDFTVPTEYKSEDTPEGVK